jgi:hypothetical protein
VGIFGNIFKKEAPPEEETQASNRVLDILKRRRGEETGKWLNLLRDPSMIPKPPAMSTIDGVDKREAEDGSLYTPPVETTYTPLEIEGAAPAVVRRAQALTVQSPLADWVNKFFDEFATQAGQFNATAEGTGLMLSVSPPEFNYQAAQYGSYAADKKVSTIKGHVASLHWALLFQGTTAKINIYILPSDELLTLVNRDAGEAGYAPFMTMESSEKGEDLEWYIGGTLVAEQSIPLLARELVGDLIRVSSGTMNESELFAHHHTELKLGETVASGYTPAPAPANAGTTAPAAAGSASGDTAGGGTAALATFAACKDLLKAIDQDLSVLSEQEGEFERDQDEVALKRLHDYSARLRTLSGLASGLLADYQPSQGAKYRPS